ncbi:MAG: hypothetical protein ABL985_06240 [Casimicrobium sp.]
MAGEIAELQEEEQAAVDNTPESLRDSERAQRSQECSDQIESAVESLGSAVDDLENAIA